MKKPTIFITNIKSTHNFLHFHKDLRSRNFWQWNDGLLKAADFVKHKKQNNLNSPNFSNITKGTLIVKDCDIAIYPCSNYGPSNLLFPLNSFCKVLDLKSLWKSMKLWELLISLMKTAGFFMRSLAKAVRNHQSEQMKNWKQAF